MQPGCILYSGNINFPGNPASPSLTCSLKLFMIQKSVTLRVARTVVEIIHNLWSYMPFAEIRREVQIKFIYSYIKTTFGTVQKWS